MERIVYIRGKFRGTNKEMKEVYLYAKEMMTKYDLQPQYIGVIATEGWERPGILTIKRKEKQLLEDLEKNKKIESVQVITKEMEGKEIIDNKSYFSIDKERRIIEFWTNTNIEEIDFKEILEEMKKYVEPGIEEICDWESDEIPLRYIWEGEKILIPDKIFPIKVTHIYKKITPLDIPTEV